MPGSEHLVDAILQQCSASAPEPWYPSAYVQETGTPRESLDPFLDQLRMSGLIRLTDWVQGKGQGYALTEPGWQVLKSDRQRARLRAGEFPSPMNQARPSLIVDRGEAVPIGWARAEAVRNAFLSHSTPVVTLALVGANILWFVYGLAVASSEGIPAQDYFFNTDAGVTDVLHQIGSLRGADIYVRHEWWRLLSCCFVHIGLIHLAVNMYSLFVVGPLLERLWGRVGFFLLYLIAGLGGSCGMLIGNPLGGGAGASGALWGIMASLATWLFLNRRVLPPALISQMQRQLITVFLLNIFITFGIAQISKGAHFGGGIVGLVTALPVDVLRFGRGRQWWTALGALVAIPTVCVAGLVISLNHSGGTIAQIEERRTAIELLKETRSFLQRDAGPVLDEAPVDRSASPAKNVMEEVGRLRAQFKELKEQFKRDGETTDPEHAKSRRTLVAFLERVLVLLDQIEKRLRRAEPWNEEDQRLWKWFMAETENLQ